MSRFWVEIGHHQKQGYLQTAMELLGAKLNTIRETANSFIIHIAHRKQILRLWSQTRKDATISSDSLREELLKKPPLETDDDHHTITQLKHSPVVPNFSR